MHTRLWLMARHQCLTLPVYLLSREAAVFVTNNDMFTLHTCVWASH